MRILVTGAGGFAGTHLLAELTRRGEHEITAGSLDKPAHLVGGVDGAGVSWLSLDVTSTESTRAVVREVRPDQIYHLAGQASVSESFRAPLDTWRVNATGTLETLEALRLEGLSSSRLLLTSSAEVYGSLPEDSGSIEENHPLRPLTPYGSSKAAAEILAFQYARANTVDVVVARSFNHVGPGQDERFVLSSFARQLIEIRRTGCEPVLKVGQLDVKRDFLDVRDTVRGYVAIMERGEAATAYNVSSGNAVPLLDVVQRLVELSETHARLEVDPDRVRPVDIPTLSGNSARLRALGWAPEIPLDQSLRELLNEAETRAAANG